MPVTCALQFRVTRGNKSPATINSTPQRKHQLAIATRIHKRIGTRKQTPSKAQVKPLCQPLTKAIATTTPSESIAPIGRESHFNTLLTHFQTTLPDCSSSFYICGTPGTGKTHTLTHLISHLHTHQTIAFSEYWINCATFSTSTYLYTHLCNRLDLPTSTPRESLREFATTPGDAIILILDEIDFLVSADQMVLYFVYELAKIKNSRISIIGIANSLDLPVRLLPWLRTNGCMPEVMRFEPYQSQDLVQIAEVMLGNNTKGEEKKEEENKKTGLAPIALSLAAKKVAAVSGDARLMLDVVRQAWNEIEKKGSKSALEDVSAVTMIMNRRGADAVIMDTVKQLPVQQQLVLCVAANKVLFSNGTTKRKGNTRRKDTLGGLYDAFGKVATKVGVKCVTFEEFKEICCNALVHHGLLVVERGKKILPCRQWKVALKVGVDDLRNGVKGRRFLERIIGDER